MMDSLSKRVQQMSSPERMNDTQAMAQTPMILSPAACLVGPLQRLLLRLLSAGVGSLPARVLMNLPLPVTVMSVNDGGAPRVVYRNLLSKQQQQRETEQFLSTDESEKENSGYFRLLDTQLLAHANDEPQLIKSCCGGADATVKRLASGHVVMVEHCNEQANSDAAAYSAILLDIFPQHVLDTLALVRTKKIPNHVGHSGRAHPSVTVAFLDVVGFTSMAGAVDPCAVMTMLNILFTVLDQLTDACAVKKVETAGDCYIVADGLREDASPVQSARHVLDFAVQALESVRGLTMPNGRPLRIRVGAHTGRCVSGIVGVKVPKFGIFGDTMNTASRMESTGVPGGIQISQTLYDVLQLHSDAEWKPTGGIKVKGKGDMQTYVWKPKDGDGAGAGGVLPEAPPRVSLSFPDTIMAVAANVERAASASPRASLTSTKNQRM